MIVGDLNPQRLSLAKHIGCETIDVTKSDSLADQIEAILGVRQVDCSVECVGFEAHGYGKAAKEENPSMLLDSLMEITRATGGIGVPGVYLPETKNSPNPKAEKGIYDIRFGLGWAKAQFAVTGQCPVKQHNRKLMEAILHDRIHPGKAVNVSIISLDEAPHAYEEFDQGVARKFVIDPHGMVKKAKA